MTAPGQGLELSLSEVSARHPQARACSVPALEALQLKIAAGEQLAIIGPSGAGKTTLMQLLGCALRPSAGQLRLDDRDPWSMSASELRQQRGELFLAPQLPPLPPRQRVVTAVQAGRLPAMGLAESLLALFYPRDIPAAFEALEKLDLGDKLFDRVDRLSGGERQRVGLARALLAPARLWLLDEPLAALDPVRSQQAIAVMRAQARVRGVTLVATLHQVDVALQAFPRLIGMREGRILFDLPSGQVTKERLAELYQAHEDELAGDQPQASDRPAAPEPVVMQCR